MKIRHSFLSKSTEVGNTSEIYDVEYSYRMKLKLQWRIEVEKDEYIILVFIKICRDGNANNHLVLDIVIGMELELWWRIGVERT